MKITALLENDRLPHRPDLRAEHGVSLHITWGDRSILFDTGASDAFAENAGQLGVSIADVTHAVLSHYHYDHGGGLERFFAENDHAPLFLRPPPAGQGFGRVLGGLITKPVDIDRALLDAHAARLVHVEHRQELAPGAVLLTDIGRAHPLPPGNQRLFLKVNGAFVPDPFEHELLLVLVQDSGLVVLTGCSHRGILNMVDAVMDAFPDTPIRALLGGFHLIGLPVVNTMAGSREEVAEIGRRLAYRKIERIYTFHCTGPKAYRVLHDVLGDRLAPFPTGSTLEL